MGKRKKAQRKVQKRVVPKLAKVFNCPMCGAAESCTCYIDRKEGKATISCCECKKSFISDKVTKLTAPIDVYCMWRDELEAENVDPATYGDEIDD